MALTHDRLTHLLEYDPVSGIFRNKVFRSSNAKKGDIAGTMDHYGYWQIQIDGKIYKAHRLAWFFMNGEWPSTDIDHDDTNKNNNSWVNLRLSTKTMNAANCHKRSSNTSGYKGVTWDKQKGRWMAQLQVNKRFVYIGRFDDPEEAHAAYVAASQKHFGEFARSE